MSIPTGTDRWDGSDASPGLEAFAPARACFATIAGWLAGQDSSALGHGELEQQLDARGRELLRLLFQDHLVLRALREERLEVADPDGSYRTRAETGHTRGLATIFGEVTVTRLAYREAGQPNLHPADRHHRRCLPTSRQRPDGPHWCPLGTARRRGHPQAPSAT